MYGEKGLRERGKGKGKGCEGWIRQREEMEEEGKKGCGEKTGGREGERK